LINNPTTPQFLPSFGQQDPPPPPTQEELGPPQQEPLGPIIVQEKTNTDKGILDVVEEEVVPADKDSEESKGGAEIKTIKI
jgi:hypothetical protein